jgi:hypothetical protein
MTKALLLLVCIAMVGCKGRELTQVVDPCSADYKGKRVICLRQWDDGNGKPACKVIPHQAAIDSGDQVVFVASKFTQTQVAVFELKRSSPLQFQGGRPGKIPSEANFDAGPIRGAPLQTFEYTVYFKTAASTPCQDDPVICIKSGGPGSSCRDIDVDPGPEPPPP